MSETPMKLESQEILRKSQQNLYPTIANSNPNPAQSPVPYNVVYFPQTNIQNEEKLSVRTPLLGTAPHYAIYHPKGVISYAKESRVNCCCVSTCAICTLCCCMFFISTVVLGGIIGAYVATCSSFASDSVTYSAPYDGVNKLQLINHNGYITIDTIDDPNATNITISITRRAANSDQLNNFDTVFYTQNGLFYFEEKAPSTENNWQNFLPCTASDISVKIPKNLRNLTEINLNTFNGNMVVSSPLTINVARLTTTNGNAEITNLQSNTIHCSTTNGNLNIQNVEAGQVTLSTTNGGIQVSNLLLWNVTSASISGSTTNGGINANGISLEGTTSIDFQTTNGDISTSVENFLGNFDVRTTNGDASVNGQNIQYTTNNWNQKTGSVGSGSSKCTLVSTNGPVSFTVNN